MFVFKTRYPYIGGQKIPLNYYSMLYPQLERVWRELVEYLDRNNISYRKDLHNLEIVVDRGKAVETLAMIHRSFMDVEGYYRGERIDRRIFLKHLWDKYVPSMINELEQLAESLRRNDLDSAYKHAYNALRIVAETEVIHAETGGGINRSIFEMLHGNIPQTFINTYLLASYGSRTVEKIAPKIYDMIIEDAVKVVAVLRANRRMVERVGEDNSAGIRE